MQEAERNKLMGSLGMEKAGANWIGLCPFHTEKTPSFTVSDNKNMFYCFGCHKGGSINELPQELSDRKLFQCIHTEADGLESPEMFNLKFKMGDDKYEDVYVVHKTYDDEPGDNWQDLYHITNPLHWKYFLINYLSTRDMFSEKAKNKVDRMLFHTFPMVARKPSGTEKKITDIENLENLDAN